MTTAIDVLSKVSGVPRAEALALWEQVRANSARLKGCEGPHEFVEHEKTGALVRSYRCTKCEGTMPAHDKRRYDEGLEHGRRERTTP